MHEYYAGLIMIKASHFLNFFLTMKDATSNTTYTVVTLNSLTIVNLGHLVDLNCNIEAPKSALLVSIACKCLS